MRHRSRGRAKLLTPKLADPLRSNTGRWRKSYDDAMAALSKLAEKAKTEAERQEIYRDHGLPEKEFNPRFLALAQRYPNDPAAVDAMVWIIEKTTRYSDGYTRWWPRRSTAR